MQDIDIIKAMEKHAAEYGPSVASIGQSAVKNRHAYDRIKKGTAHRETGSRVMEWIVNDRSRKSAGAAS